MKKLKNHPLQILRIVFILLFTGCSNQNDLTVTAADGVRISFEKHGSGELAIVFVHGWSNNRNIWDDQLSYFSQNYMTVGIDLAGFGNSGNNRDSWTTSAFGDDVVAVINELNLDKVVLIGFSMGGPVCIEAAVKSKGKIVGIVLVDTMQDIDRIRPDEEIAYIDSVFMDIVTNPAPEKLENVFYRYNKEASFQRVLQMLEGTEMIGWRESLYETGRWMNDDCKSRLKLIEAPIVAINSDAQPTNIEGYKGIVPSFNFYMMEDVGHVVFWDKPEEFNKLLEESIRDFMLGH